MEMIGLGVLLATTLGTAIPFSFTEQIDRTVTEQMRVQRIPGIAVGVNWHGVSVYVKGFGERDQARHLPANSVTHFEIGSISKQFTAAAVLRLAREGKLSLDDPLSKFVPQYARAANVTVREMLEQTSGIPDTQDFAPDARPGDSLGTLVARLQKKPLGRTPGTGFAYSNTNYVLLARVVEVASGEPYETYLRASVLAPPGLREITMIGEVQAENTAIGYHLAGDHVVASGPMDPAKVRGAGSLVASVSVLLRWNAELYGGHVIPPGDVATMTARTLFPDGTAGGYGLGVAVDDVAHRKHVWHDGQTFGSAAYLAHFPQSDIDIVVLANQSDADVDGLASAIERIALRAWDPAFTTWPRVHDTTDPVDLYFRALAATKTAPAPPFLELTYTIRVEHRNRRRAQAWRGIVRTADAQGRYDALNGDGSRTGDVHVLPTAVPPALFLAHTTPSQSTVAAGVDAAPEPALSTIGSVRASSYTISLDGSDDANGCPAAYRLRLVPKHDPKIFNLRALWIDRSSLQICRAQLAWTLMIIVPTPVMVTADVDPDGYVSHWTTTGTGHTSLGPYTASADARYTDIRTYEGNTDPKLFRR